MTGAVNKVKFDQFLSLLPCEILVLPLSSKENDTKDLHINSSLAKLSYAALRNKHHSKLEFWGQTECLIWLIFA